MDYMGSGKRQSEDDFVLFCFVCVLLVVVVVVVVVLGIEIRASHLLSKCSATWAMSPDFGLKIF
jgi:hypothetical protein